MGSQRVVRVDSESGLGAALRAAGLEDRRPVLVVVGGASGLRGEAEERVRATVEDVVLPLAVEHGVTIVDGGTDSGVMRMLGVAHRAAGARSPLVGVAVRDLVQLPDAAGADAGGPGGGDPAQEPAPAESHHTHLVLVPGRRWGDESPWLSAVAEWLRSSGPAVTLVLNGGAITLADVAQSVAAGRPVVTVAGTGRSADLLAAVGGTPPAGPGPTAVEGADLTRAARAAAVEGSDITPAPRAAAVQGADVARAAAAAGLLSVLDPTRPLGDQRAQLARMLRADRGDAVPGRSA